MKEWANGLKIYDWEGETCTIKNQGHMIKWLPCPYMVIRAVAGQRSSPDLCFATKFVKIYDP